MICGGICLGSLDDDDVLQIHSRNGAGFGRRHDNDFGAGKTGSSQAGGKAGAENHLGGRRCRDIDAIKGFLAKENKINDQNKDGYSILHAAIRKGRLRW